MKLKYYGPNLNRSQLPTPVTVAQAFDFFGIFFN